MNELSSSEKYTLSVHTPKCDFRVIVSMSKDIKIEFEDGLPSVEGKIRWGSSQISHVPPEGANMCKRPMTQVAALEKHSVNGILSETHSMLCKNCKLSMYFTGNPTDDDMPTRFACPYCGKTNHCIG